MTDPDTITPAVSFRRMQDGTAEDYALLEKLEEAYASSLPERIEAQLRRLDNSFADYQVSHLRHSLQSATRAWRDNRCMDDVVVAPVHDIGDELAPYSHSELAAAILRPYVDKKLYWIVKTHGVFQLYHYGEQAGLD